MTEQCYVYTNKNQRITCDEDDYEWITANRPYYLTNHGLVARARRKRDPEYYKGTLIQLTREILGFAPQEYRVLHMNGDKLDVRKENIKYVTASANQRAVQKKRPVEETISREPVDWRENVLEKVG
tara:strand:- start:524 stop:901 length:378 start_codon:yes stop_codon:yes gene_type:complete